VRVKVAHLVLLDGQVHEIEEAGPIPGSAGFYPDRPFRIAMATILPDGWSVGWFTNRCEYDIFATGLTRGRAERRLRRVVARGGEIRP
jgi:hypothetical protein